MFSTRKDSKTNSYILTPKWNKTEKRQISFSSFKTVDAHPYLLVVFDEASAEVCQEWIKLGESGEYRDIIVKDSVVQLKLLKEETQNYGRTTTPTDWDKHLITLFRAQESKEKTGEWSGFLDCSSDKLPLLNLLMKETHPERKELFMSDLLTFQDVSGIKVSEAFVAINGDSTFQGSRYKVSPLELWAERLEFIRKRLSSFMFQGDETRSFEDIEKEGDKTPENRKALELYINILKSAVQ